MTLKQLDELSRLPSWIEYEVKRRLIDAQKITVRKDNQKRVSLMDISLDGYDERLAIMCEEREIKDDDLIAAWKSVFHTKFEDSRKRKTKKA